jgi:uncharacterized protein (DUF433 family)
LNLKQFSKVKLNSIKMGLKITSIISIDPETLGGTPVFRGTRVPIKALFDHLRRSSLEEFFMAYPHITKEMVDELFAAVSLKFSKQKIRKRHESADRRTVRPKNEERIVQV